MGGSNAAAQNGSNDPEATHPRGDPEDTDDGDTQMLQARSRELQDRIKTLETISLRRDKQLQKMMSRQAGAMEMLAAVQDMCAQQKKVIEAQKTAIHERRTECGETDGAPNLAEDSMDSSRET